MPPSVEALNAVSLFQNRIQFTWLRRRGSLIQAGFADGREVQWNTPTDLRVFARSQDLLFQATGFLIPSPANKSTRRIWEPVAQLIRRIADGDATDMLPPLKDEFEQLIRSTWIRAGRPEAFGKEEFFHILRACQQHTRVYEIPKPGDTRVYEPPKPPRCCVWLGGAGEPAMRYCWIYQDALLSWLSTAPAKGRHYPWDDVRVALLLLDFEPVELHRSLGKERVHVRVWRGPADLLIDDGTMPETPLETPL
jgi:hypothetical protein